MPLIKQTAAGSHIKCNRIIINQNASPTPLHTRNKIGQSANIADRPVTSAKIKVFNPSNSLMLSFAAFACFQQDDLR